MQDALKNKYMFKHQIITSFHKEIIQSWKTQRMCHMKNISTTLLPGVMWRMFRVRMKCVHLLLALQNYWYSNNKHVALEHKNVSIMLKSKTIPLVIADCIVQQKEKASTHKTYILFLHGTASLFGRNVSFGQITNQLQSCHIAW